MNYAEHVFKRWYNASSIVNLGVGVSLGSSYFNAETIKKIEGDRLSLNATIKRGDLIVTSGLERIYPAGITLGKVLTVHDDKVT